MIAAQLSEHLHLKAPSAFLALAISVVGVESLLLIALCFLAVDPLIYLLLHTMIVLAIIGLWHVSTPRTQVRELVTQLAFWTAIAGPFGAAIAASLSTIAISHQAKADSFGEWLDDQVKGQIPASFGYERLHRSLLDGRLRIGGASSAMTLTDVFTEGTLKQKFDALAVIARRYDPALSRALRAALKDSEPSVRVLASTVMVKVQAGYSERIVRLRKQDLSPQTSPKTLEALAAAHWDYGTSGLLESTQSQSEQRRAIECLELVERWASNNALSQRLRDWRRAVGANRVPS